MFIEILFKMLLFKGGVLIYAEHCMCVCIYFFFFFLRGEIYKLILLFIKDA